MKRKGSGLDLSLVQNRDAKKLKHDKEGFLRKHREIISAIFLSFALGTGTGLILTNVKVPIEGPGSPKIQLIQKLKYEFFDLINDIRGKGKDENDKEIQIPVKSKGDSKIHIDLKPPKELDCKANNEDCLVS